MTLSVQGGSTASVPLNFSIPNTPSPHRPGSRAGSVLTCYWSPRFDLPPERRTERDLGLRWSARSSAGAVTQAPLDATQSLELDPGPQTIVVDFHTPAVTAAATNTILCDIPATVAPGGTFVAFSAQIAITVTPGSPSPGDAVGASVVVVGSPQRVRPGSTFSVVTRWTIPQSGGYLGRRHYADWTGSTGGLVYVGATLPTGASITLRETRLDPGVAELTHTYRVAADARAGTHRFEFRLHDEVAGQRHVASVNVSVQADAATSSWRIPPPPVALPGESVTVEARWTLPDWVENPQFLVLTSSNVGFERLCVNTFCAPVGRNRSGSVRAGRPYDVRVQLRVSDGLRGAVGRAAAFVHIALIEAGRSHSRLEGPFEVGSEPRISLGGAGGSCTDGTGFCVDLPATPAGTPATAVVQLRNAGTAGLNYSLGRATGFFAGSDAPGGFLGPGVGTTFTVRFAPPADRSRLTAECRPAGILLRCEHTIPLTSNDPTRPSATVRLRGLVDAPPAIEITGDLVDDTIVQFGLVEVGGRATRAIHITNVGGQTAVVSVPARLPDTSAGITFRETGPRTLRHGNTLHVGFVAVPTASGVHDIPFEIRADDDHGRPQTRVLRLRLATGPVLHVIDRGEPGSPAGGGSRVPVGGTIDFPFVTLAPQPHAYDRTTAVPAPRLRRIALRNASESATPLRVRGELRAIHDAGDWSLDGDSVAPFPMRDRVLQPGEEVEVVVGFSPKRRGDKAAALELDTDAANYPRPAQVRLRAKVVRPAGALAIDIDPPNSRSRIAYGQVARGHQVSAEVRLRNTGGPGSGVQVTASIEPPNAAFELGLFAEVRRTFELLPSAGEILSVTFAPDTLGPAEARLVLVTDDPAARRVEIPLAGEGMAFRVPQTPVIPVYAEPIEVVQLLAQSYHEFDLALRSYLGAPRLSNWMTYTKHLTHHTGAELRHTLALARLTMLFADLQGSRAVACRAMAPPPESCPDILRRVDPGSADQFDTLVSVLRNLTARDALTRVPLAHAVSRAPGIAAAGDAEETAIAVAEGWIAILIALYDVMDRLTNAELSAYRATVGAVQQFLTEENDNVAGSPATRVYPGDQRGLLAQAFAHYQEARRLGLQAARPGVADAARLLREREAAVIRGNQLVALHQQLVLQVELYDAWQTLGPLDGFTFTVPGARLQRMTPRSEDFYTRLGIDSRRAPVDPHAITAATAPLLGPIPGTIGGYLWDFILEPAIGEHPARVPLPGPAGMRWSPPAGGNVVALLALASAAINGYGFAAEIAEKTRLLPLPNPSANLPPNAVRDVANWAGAFCAAVETGAGLYEQRLIEQYAGLCDTVGDGVAAGLGDPVAIVSGGILMAKALTHLFFQLLAMESYLSCWPNCHAEPALEAWLYR